MVYQHPRMQLTSVLEDVKFKKRTKEELTAPIGFLLEKFKEIGTNKPKDAKVNWVMGELRKQALGNIDLKELRKTILK